MTNDAFVDVFVVRLDSATIAIVEIPLRPIGDMGAQVAIRLRLCDQVATFMRSERIAMDHYSRELTDGDFGEHGDRLGTNQRSVSPLGDLGALTNHHRSPPRGMGV